MNPQLYINFPLLFSIEIFFAKKTAKKAEPHSDGTRFPGPSDFTGALEDRCHSTGLPLCPPSILAPPKLRVMLMIGPTSKAPPSPGAHAEEGRACWRIKSWTLTRRGHGLNRNRPLNFGWLRNSHSDDWRKAHDYIDRGIFETLTM